MVELQTARLHLREFDNADIPVLHAYNLHPAFRRYESGLPVSEYQFHQIVQGIIAEQAQPPRKRYHFVISRAAQVVGSCYVAIRDMDHRQGEIGYMIGFEHWGDGYATEAARALLKLGFETLHLHRIYANAISENSASLRVLEKIGMRREGLLCETDYFQNRWWDTCIYALLEDNWHQEI